MPAYEATLFEPPAPMAAILLRNPENGASWSDVPMLLDTGADITLLPANAVNKLALTLGNAPPYELAAFDGAISQAPVVMIELVFCRRIFRGQFLLIEQEWGILRRNVLNVVSILLDGPGLQWAEQRP